MSIPRILHLVGAALLLALSVSALAAPGSVLKPDTLRAQPFKDAQATGKVNKGDTVEILKKDGGWVQVKSAGGQGWLRSLNVRLGAPAAGGSSAASLAALASGRAGTGKVVSTTGVRGLNEEELKAAKFDAQQLKTLDGYAITRQQAEKFAAAGKLKPIAVDYLPEPK